VQRSLHSNVPSPTVPSISAPEELTLYCPLTSHQSLYRGAYALMSPPPQSHQSLYQRSLHSNVPSPTVTSVSAPEELTL
ncbi:unnamed protein product, partial [Staurois parvus]